MRFDKVMHMKTVLTVTRKGQTTLPAAVRRKLGVGKNGGTLHISYNEAANELIISKPLTIDELAARVSSYIKPGTPPLMDASGFYQTREPRL